MSLLISFLPSRRSAAEDAASRLGILYPSIKINIHVDALELSNVPQEQADEVAQVVSDQLMRSQYAQDTAGLRDRLYARLLG